MKKVFVCYDHSEDSQFKDVIRSWNTDGDFEFVFDQRPPDMSLTGSAAEAERAEVTDLLKRAEYLLVIIGEKAHESKWMAWEIETAKQRGIKLKLAAVKTNETFVTPGGLTGTGVSYATVFTREAVYNALKEASNVDFNSLYDIYNAGHLVMIVGSEVLRMNDPQSPGSSKTFEQRAIEAIINDECSSHATFSETAIRYPNAKISSSRLTGIYRRFQPQNFDISLIQLIAELPKIRLFIQTCFDTKLQEQLGENVDVEIWNHEARRPLYLDLANGRRKLVYLFGSVDDEIAVFEEEQIDCLLNLSVQNEINKSTTPDRYSFLEYLRNKTLVFIGNNFPDWFMRLLLRTLYNEPITEQLDKAYIVNDYTRGVSFEKYFYEKFKIELIHDFPIRHFLQNFHKIIDEKEPLDNWYKPKKVFISYDRADSVYAKELKKCLNRRHIDAFLDTDDMAIAEHQRKIMQLIQAPETCVFVCILSGALAEKEKKNSYVKRIEWEVASSRFVLNSIMHDRDGGDSYPPFIVVPTAIDSFNNYYESLPDFITVNNILPFDTTVLCNLIEKTIKNITYEYRKPLQRTVPLHS